MTSPDRNTHNDQDPATALGEGLDRILEGTDPDLRQAVLIDALMKSIQNDGMDPRTFELLGGVFSALDASRNEAMARGTADPIIPETAGQEPKIAEASPEPSHSTAELGRQASHLAAVRSIDTPVTTAPRPTIETHERDDALAEKIKEIAGSTLSRTLYGKFENGIRLERLSDSVGESRRKAPYDRSPYDGTEKADTDWNSYFGWEFHRKYVDDLGRAMTGIRGQLRFDESHVLNTTPLVAWAEAHSPEKGSYTIFYYSFPTKLALDDRPNFDVSFSTLMPKSEGDELKKLIASDPRALEVYLQNVAGGLRELDEENGRVGKDRVMIGDDYVVDILRKARERARVPSNVAGHVYQATIPELLSTNPETGKPYLRVVRTSGESDAV